MKPKKPANKNQQMELFRVELSQIVDLSHSLIKLSIVVDWEQLEEVFGSTYCPDNGRPAISTRMMVALHYLKYTHNLSDDYVVSGWVENPYWQYFSGMKWFEHKAPIHPSSMTRGESISAMPELDSCSASFGITVRDHRNTHFSHMLIPTWDNPTYKRIG